MRRLECLQVEAQLARRMLKKDALGGERECFSQETTLLRASRIPEDGEMRMGERGARYPERVRLILSKGVRARVGDGVWMEEKKYRILSIQRWLAHVEWLCEAME